MKKLFERFFGKKPEKNDDLIGLLRSVTKKAEDGAVVQDPKMFEKMPRPTPEQIAELLIHNRPAPDCVFANPCPLLLDWEVKQIMGLAETWASHQLELARHVFALDPDNFFTNPDKMHEVALASNQPETVKQSQVLAHSARDTFHNFELYLFNLSNNKGEALLQQEQIAIIRALAKAWVTWRIKAVDEKTHGKCEMIIKTAYSALYDYLRYLQVPLVKNMAAAH